MNPIDIALRIATSAHAGQLDCDGYPVILHPLTVGLRRSNFQQNIKEVNIGWGCNLNCVKACS